MSVMDIPLLLIGAWAAYSLICILEPFKPFSTRDSAFISLLLSLIVLPIVAYSIPGQGDRANTALPASCGENGVALMDIVGVSGEALLRTAPSDQAPRVKNEKASQIFGKDMFHRIDGSTTVKRLCVQEEWTQVQLTTPEHLAHVQGWVPNTALRKIEHTADGGRIYVEDDFAWDKDTSPFKPQIVAVVNRVARENANCPTPNTGVVAKSPSRSQPGDPVFFVTCGSGADIFNVWFRPGDATSSLTFQAKTPIDRVPAVRACEQAAKDAATHPSTVEFSKIMDLAYKPHASGRAQVFSSFTAKNGFNLELEYQIRCLFDGNTLIETHIAEKRG